MSHLRAVGAGAGKTVLFQSVITSNLLLLFPQKARSGARTFVYQNVLKLANNAATLL